MNEIAAALVMGVAAGLAVALPVGPVALLVLQEGLARGFRIAAGAAVGVAAVDTLYAVAATTAGGEVARVLDGHALVVRGVSAVALVAVAAWGLRQTIAARAGSGTPTAAAWVERATPSRTFARFVGLTAVTCDGTRLCDASGGGRGTGSTIAGRPRPSGPRARDVCVTSPEDQRTAAVGAPT